MKKQLNIVAKIGLCLIGCFLVATGFTSSSSAEAQYYGHEITYYGVDVTANRDNTYCITEYIYVYHWDERHGIQRDIPHKFHNMRAKISNISVAYSTSEVDWYPSYEVFNYNDIPKRLSSVKRNVSSISEKDSIFKVKWYPGFTRIRIGDPDKTIAGFRVYVISYTLDLGKDQAIDSDCIYLNIIGHDTAVPVNWAEFAVNLSQFSEVQKNIIFYSGYEGETAKTDMVWHDVKNDRILGCYGTMLEPYQGITLKVDMPEGTFVGDKNPFDLIKALAYSFSLIVSVCVVLLYFFFGREDKVIPVIEFSPPDKLTPAEIGYIIDEVVDDEDIGAMIIYWASHGHLSIKERKNHAFTLYKTSDLDQEGHYDYEHEAFNKLFKLGNGEKVTSGQLKNSYYVSARKLKLGTYTPYSSEERMLYDKKSDHIANVAIALGGLCFAMLFFILFWIDLSGDDGVVIYSVILSGCTTLAYRTLSSFFTLFWQKWHRRKSWLNALLTVFYVLIFLLLVWIVNSLCIEYLNALEINLLLGASLLSLLLKPLIRKKTEYGRNIMGRILGFKQFLVEVEKDRIKVLFEENPEYFYNILPYAMVLGISHKWISKFKDLLTTPPSWYTPYDMHSFRPQDFMQSMTRTTSSVSEAAVSSPSSSSSSGYSSGGGCSGGGGGGGSVGTW